MYFNVNLMCFFKQKVLLLVSELYNIKMHGATIKNMLSWN